MNLLLLVLLAVEQPIPFSHKTHTDTAKLACKDCHTMSGRGERAGIPATAKCMACHVIVKADSPAIIKLAEFHKDKRPVNWKRVYEIPGYVFFSHRVHVEGGATCASCHGPVAERDVLTKEIETNMGACMTCHVKYKAPNECTACHETRN